MKILANENFPQAAVLALRGAGHDVLWARQETPGASDEDVMARAAAEQRLLVTTRTSVNWRTGGGSRRRVAWFSSDSPFRPLSLRRTAQWRCSRVARTGRGSSLLSRRRAFAFALCSQALDAIGR